MVMYEKQSLALSLCLDLFLYMGKNLLSVFVCFQDSVSYSLGWLQTCYVAKYDLTLLILLPQCWDYRHAPPCWVLYDASN